MDRAADVLNLVPFLVNFACWRVDRPSSNGSSAAFSRGEVTDLGSRSTTLPKYLLISLRLLYDAEPSAGIPRGPRDFLPHSEAIHWPPGSYSRLCLVRLGNAFLFHMGSSCGVRWLFYYCAR